MDNLLLNKANIDNLTSVWRAMGAQPLPASDLHGCPGWPNRYWSDWGQNLVSNLSWQNQLQHLPARAMVPVWAADSQASDMENALQELQFDMVLQQRAMYLDLADWLPPQFNNITLRMVDSVLDLSTWIALCSSAFGYQVDEQAIRQLVKKEQASLFLAELHGKAVATAMLFQTGEVAGIHQVGVPDTFRGQGIARALMRTLLAHCYQQGTRYVTLQASTMGEGLYRQLGFYRQFDIRTYQRRR